jgi:DNA invertase Pin-like site-specific DNA recombinase
MGSESLRSRPYLQQALQLARKEGIPVIVSDISRLSRDIGVVDDVLKLGVQIISATEGYLDAATLAARIAKAAAHGANISATTKLGMQALKQQGKVYGNPRNLPAAQKKGAESNKLRRVAKVREIVDALKNQPAGTEMTASQVVELLNRLGIRSGRDKEWTLEAVRRPLQDARRIILDERLNKHPFYGRF